MVLSMRKPSPALARASLSVCNRMCPPIPPFAPESRTTRSSSGASALNVRVERLGRGRGRGIHSLRRDFFLHLLLAESFYRRQRYSRFTIGAGVARGHVEGRTRRCSS